MDMDMKRKTKKNYPNSAQWLAVMRRARQELGMTQAQFAAAIGMSKDAVTSWECGRNRIGRTSALRMSVWLGCNILAGNLDPIDGEDLIRVQVADFERALRRRVGPVGQVFQPAGSPDFPVRCAPPHGRCSERATGKSPAPADRNVCPTSA